MKNALIFPDVLIFVRTDFLCCTRCLVLHCGVRPSKIEAMHIVSQGDARTDGRAHSVTTDASVHPSGAIDSIQVNASVSTGCARPSIRASACLKLHTASILDGRTLHDATIEQKASCAAQEVGSRKKNKTSGTCQNTRSCI